MKPNKNKKGGTHMNVVRRKNNGFWTDPFRELDRVQRDLGSLFDALVPREEGRSEQLANWAPPVDITETENEYLVKADLPGLDKKDIDVTVENGVLTIKGEKKEEHESKKKGMHRSERYFGSFYRAIALPSGIDETKLSAKHKNGVLELTLPKTEEAKPKQIKVDIN